MHVTDNQLSFTLPTDGEPLAQGESLSSDQLQEQAKAITVRVLSGESSWGSGILLCQTGQFYTVLTADHVLGIDESYRIELSNGQSYPARRLDLIHVGNSDIGLLEFRGGETSLPLAVIGGASSFAVGDSVYAAGFSFEASLADPSQSFILTTGKVSLLSEQPFQNGYQIGYTNTVKQGMSGGPLLNRQGQVIGMNGMDKYPLWGNPYVFKDGSIPAVSLREQMRKLSWAIPMQAVLELLRELNSDSAAPDASPCIPNTVGLD
ncbi:MAG: trypsin-like peptidase domain-containing protein [Cyanobacteria bacterium RM1_2_2]|nr:trypsin-like peptidase domain-containing protein [Cyanobacteria bacterium RM1_2_2]